MKRETGPIRRLWNYFKRGKNEINFLLNIYQTLIMIWAGSTIAGNFNMLMGFSIIFGAILFIVSIGIGKYSLTKVDTSMPYINPFTQDVVRWRALMATGNQALAVDNKLFAANCFSKAEEVLARWLNDD